MGGGGEVQCHRLIAIVFVFLKIEKLPRRKFWIISIFLIRNMSFATNVQEPWS